MILREEFIWSQEKRFRVEGEALRFLPLSFGRWHGEGRGKQPFFAFHLRTAFKNSIIIRVGVVCKY